MSNHTPQLPNDHTDWQLLAEFLIPTAPELENNIVEHIGGSLRQFGLERRQMSQIMSAIDQSLQNLEGSLAPLHLKISGSGLDLGEMLLEDNLERQRDLETAGSGLGFFLVKRIVGRVQDPDPAKYRLLEVLIYRESGQAKA